MHAAVDLKELPRSNTGGILLCLLSHKAHRDGKKEKSAPRKIGKHPP
jgi:hypothetical protein